MSGPSMNRGFNAFHGFDSGPPPPAFGPQQPQGQWGGHWGGGWAPAQPVCQQPVVQTWGPPPQLSAQPPSGPSPAHPAPQWLGQPPPAPPSDGPKLELKNPWGGIGCPPGVQYMFPEKTCPFNVLTTKEKPWHIEHPFIDQHGRALVSFIQILVPLSTTVKEMMKNLGCTNKLPEKNKLYEITECGNGKWRKGITISGDQKAKVEKPITHFQWDEKRTGKKDEGPVIWIYLEKD